MLLAGGGGGQMGCAGLSFACMFLCVETQLGGGRNTGSGLLDRWNQCRGLRNPSGPMSFCEALSAGH